MRQARCPSPAAPTRQARAAFHALPAHRLLRPIGEGSYGKIWLAINAMGTYRVMKVVNRSRFKQDRPYEREFEGIKISSRALSPARASWISSRSNATIAPVTSPM